MLALRSRGELFFYAPCCGLAWRSVEHAAELNDDWSPLANVADGLIVLPTKAELVAAGLGDRVGGALEVTDYSELAPLVRRTNREG